MAYKHYKHSWFSEPGTFLYWREGWPIEDPSPRYSSLSNWDLIETLNTVEQIPEQYRTQVRQRGFLIYRKGFSDVP